MSFIDWIKSFFGLDQATVYIDQKALDSTEEQLAIEYFAITSAINLIASAISKCEFKTYSNGSEIKSGEYYLWNIEPNKNQNSSQFLQEVISKLLYYNECLVVEIGGQLIIADDFFQNEFAVAENYFTDVSRGTLTFDRKFYMSEVLYFKLGHSDIRNLLSKLIKGYNTLINMAIGKYKRSGGRKGIARVDKVPSGDEDFQKKLNELFNNKFKTYFNEENAVIHLPKGVEYSEENGEANKKTSNEISNIASISKETFERVAQCFKMPPALLRGDIADIKNITDNFLTFCIDPLCDMISEETNRKRYGKKAFLNGSYLKIDTTCIYHINIFSISEAFDKLIASGGYSIDDLRIKAGDIPLNTDWSKQHYITKNYQKIEQMEGGEI